MHVKAQSITVRLLKGAIRESGLTLQAIAEKAGISLKTMVMANSGWLITPRMSRRIEAAFGRAIWTSDAEFSRQQQLVAWLGFDPFVANRRESIALATAKGIHMGGRNPSKALIIARLFAAYDAAHPAPTPPQPRRKRAAKISTAGTPPTQKTTNPNAKRTP